MKINFTVELPEELLTEFMQHLRDYEAPRGDRVHLNMEAATDMSAEEFIQKMSKVKPEIPWQRIIPYDKT